MIILVTGCAGFIGTNFVYYYLSKYKNDIIIGLDKLTYAGNLENLADLTDEQKSRFIFYKGDICDRNIVREIFTKHEIEYLVNFAAESHVDRSIIDSTPFIDTNIKGTQVLLEAAREVGLARFLQISTDEVYGSLGPDDPPFNEESPLRPNSPYSASKAAGDLLCRAYYKTYGVPVIITRSCNNYGPWQFPEKLIPLMIRNAKRGEELPIYGDGKQRREWLYVDDHCEAVSILLRKGETGNIYNISTGCEKANIDVVETLGSLINSKFNPSWHKKINIKHIKDPRGSAHDFRYALDTSKIKEQFNWMPKITFAKGLRFTVDWYIENEKWIEKVITGEYRDYYKKIYGKYDK